MTEFLTGETGLWVLFSTGFLSATLLPGGSEANLLAALTLGDIPAWQILTVVTLGNTLGGLTNYGLGRCLPSKGSESPRAQTAMAWLRRYGCWSLLLSWLPVIGDPLCLAAGWLRLPFWWCVLAIFVGKAVRYAVLAFLVAV